MFFNEFLLSDLRSSDKRIYILRVLVVHTCNPSFSGGRDQEDHGLKPAWANSSKRPYLKKIPSQKQTGEWLKM
jgi:hypothetical protein